MTIHDVGVELDAGGRNLASVVVDSALPHLDRAFDYVVPESLLARVAVGSRVRVPFAGRLVSGMVTALPPEPPQGITLAHVRSAASVPSLTSEGIDLGRAVARRYGGSLWDVIRLMVPPRVASVEKRPWPSPGDADSVASLDAARATLAGDVPDVPLRAVWAVPPGSKRSTVPARQLLAHALAHTTARNGSAIIVVPDSRALRSLESAANEVGLRRWQPRTGGDVVVLDHDAGPTARYASYLAAMHGEARIVIGTRPVALQPVPRLASIAVWDEGSDALLEPHAPYFHARTVAAMRAQDANSAFLLAAYAPSVEAAALAEHGFVEAVVPQREQARATSPRVVIVGENVRRKEGGEGRHWMPSTAWRSLLEKAADRPVAVLVPRAGYVTALACVRCHTWATCPNCEGELMVRSATSAPVCRDCGAEHPALHCSECASPRFAAARQGVEAIAAQLRRMAPQVELHLSSAATGVVDDGVVARGIVVATPGALPAVDGGYARLAIIGADRPTPGGLGAELLAIRWWINAAALVTPARDGGTVTLVGDVLPSVRRAVQSWDPWEAAVDAYRERRELGLPPMTRALLLEGSASALDAARAALAGVGDVRMNTSPQGAVVLVSRAQAQDAVDVLRELMVARSKAGDSPLRLRVDAPLP